MDTFVMTIASPRIWILLSLTFFNCAGAVVEADQTIVGAGTMNLLTSDKQYCQNCGQTELHIEFVCERWNRNYLIYHACWSNVEMELIVFQRLTVHLYNTYSIIAYQPERPRSVWQRQHLLSSVLRWEIQNGKMKKKTTTTIYSNKQLWLDVSVHFCHLSSEQETQSRR